MLIIINNHMNHKLIHHTINKLKVNKKNNLKAI